MRAQIDRLPRRSFVPGATPLERVEALGRAFGLPGELWVKRDDLTGPGLGGNKVRKLEHLIADAEGHAADTLVTVGSAQSNHCRLTAVLGTVSGFEVHLVLGGGVPATLTGNLALDAIAGAHLHHHPSDDWKDLAVHLKDLVDQLRTEGRQPYEVPLGGSTAVGALGYVRAWFELLDQLDAVGAQPGFLVHASSSGGTQAGLLAGRALTGRGPVPIGVDVAKLADDLADDVLRLANEVLTELRSDHRVDEDEVELVDAGAAPYAELTDETAAALVTAARTSGLIVDPVYSGRALGAIPRLAREGRLDGDVVFLHTGGQPALFAKGYVEDILSRTGDR
jgi:1-aminocyclopropane-1-carboxylate deaminase/D-cysteine desulfhydrase-like pyridoxal-dependent ACC family enzyme